MHLVNPQGAQRRGFARQEMLEQVRDVGLALEYMMARYERLVRDIAGKDLPSGDFQSRVQLVNREVADVATRLQDLFVLEFEARKAEAYAEFGAATESLSKHSTAAAAAAMRRRRPPAAKRMLPVPPRVPASYGERVSVQ